MPAIKFVSTVGFLKGLRISYLHVPATVVKKLGGISSQRLICTANKVHTWQCGLVALGKGDAYISLNKKIMKEVGIAPGDEVGVTLEPDKSKYGMEMPPELKTLLSQDKEGSRRFHQLVAGKQRYVIYFVNQVKSRDLRVERAVMLIENLKGLPEGKETFKGLLAKR